MVTCPSAINTALLSLRTHSTVVPCICALPWLLRIRALYSVAMLQARESALRARGRFQCFGHWELLGFFRRGRRRRGWLGGRGLRETIEVSLQDLDLELYFP